MEKIRVPVWLLAICVFVFIGVVLEQLYHSKVPVDIWGLKLNQKQYSSILPEKSVLISDVACNRLEGDWINYEKASGRFVIGVGASTDISGKTMEFDLHDEAGEFFHTLLESEMPSHVHTQVWGQEAGNLSTSAVGNNIATYRGHEIHATQPKGGNMPHNNMPPYVSLYFCIQQ